MLSLSRSTRQAAILPRTSSRRHLWGICAQCSERAGRRLVSSPGRLGMTECPHIGSQGWVCSQSVRYPFCIIAKYEAFYLTHYLPRVGIFGPFVSNRRVTSYIVRRLRDRLSSSRQLRDDLDPPRPAFKKY